MLIYSGRKRALSGWFKLNQNEDYNSPLKLQKFLFFYEIISKIEDDSYDLKALRGYANGPVFGDVYGDYTHRKSEFSEDIEKFYQISASMVNAERAKIIGFLVNILSENELSDLTHQFNIWSAKEDQIGLGIQHVSLSENDLTQKDISLMFKLANMYSIEYINSVDVLWCIDKCFIISKENSNRLTEEHKKILLELALEESLLSPVYLTLSEDEVLLVD